MIERKGRARARVVESAQGKNLVPVERENIEHGSELHTDSWHAYELLRNDYVHSAVNHFHRISSR